jgi:hypothetical protein
MIVGSFLTRWHRRLARFGALPLALWLVSGLAMPFVGYPAVDSLRSLEALPPLGQHADVAVPVGCASGLVVERLPKTGLVTRCLEEPATSNHPLHPREAALVAQAYAQDAGALVATEVVEDADLWTLPNALQARLPAQRAHFESGLAVDVSLRTGEVMQVTNTRSRLLAWLGPIPHWLYLTPLRRHRDPWRWVVMVTSSLALLTVATGVWNGLRVALRRGFPYRRPALRLHHRWGLAAGGLALVWCVSGLLSVNPGHWSPGRRPTGAHFATWGTSPAPPTPMDWAVCARLAQPKRLVLWQIGSYRGVQCEGPNEQAFGEPPTQADLVEAASRLFGSPVAGRWEALDAEDAYLTTKAGLIFEAGPVRLAADARTGRLLQVLSTSGRAERWLYQGLHTWDFRWLVERAALRRVLQLAGLGLALGLIATGLRLFSSRLVGRSR